MWTHSKEKAEKIGHIWVITGSVMSGKTSTLIRDAEALYEANYDVFIFMPEVAKDSRPNGVQSHDDDEPFSKIHTCFVDDSIKIPDLMKADYGINNSETDGVVVLIDEAQFFEKDLYKDVMELAAMGYDVGVYGLNHDVFGTPFPAIANVMAIADEIENTNFQLKGWFVGDVPKLTDKNFDRDGCLVLTDDNVAYKPVSKQEWFKKLKEYYYV
jgi:thymidine kinase